MIVKERDATKNRIAYLETYEPPGMDTIQAQGLKRAAARLRADCTSEYACEHIDSYFAESEDWLVIHDLRMRSERQIMQINHLLINSSLEFYIVDSRYINKSLTLNEKGQCWSHIKDSSIQIAAPWNKLNRDIRILRDIVQNTHKLPRILGILPTISIHGYILTCPSQRSDKPPTKLLGASDLIASDALFATIWEKQQGWVRSKLKNIDPTTLHELGQTLLSLHIPAVATNLMKADVTHYEHHNNREHDTAHCAQCSQQVSAYARERSFRHMGELQHQVLCIDCQSMALNQVNRCAGQ